MQKVLTAMAAVAGFALAAMPSSVQAQKLGFIDSRRIVAEAPGAKEAQATFEKDMEKYRGEMKVLEDSLKSMMEDFEQKQVTLSPAAKKTRQDAIVEKQNAYQKRAAELEDIAGRRQNELVAPIMQRINKVIGELRQEGGYAMIFDVAQGAIIAADQSLDLNEEVLKRLQANSTASSGSTGGGASKAASAPAPKKP